MCIEITGRWFPLRYVEFRSNIPKTIFYDLSILFEFLQSKLVIFNYEVIS